MSNDYAQDPKALARLFHDTYERLAPSFGYETRVETRSFDPDNPNGKLMAATCAAVADAVTRDLAGESDEATLERAVKAVFETVVDGTDTVGLEWMALVLAAAAPILLAKANARIAELERENEQFKNRLRIIADGARQASKRLDDELAATRDTPKPRPTFDVCPAIGYTQAMPHDHTSGPGQKSNTPKCDGDGGHESNGPAGWIGCNKCGGDCSEHDDTPKEG